MTFGICTGAFQLLLKGQTVKQLSCFHFQKWSLSQLLVAISCFTKPSICGVLSGMPSSQLASFNLNSKESWSTHEKFPHLDPCFSILAAIVEPMTKSLTSGRIGLRRLRHPGLTGTSRNAHSESQKLMSGVMAKLDISWLWAVHNEEIYFFKMRLSNTFSSIYCNSASKPNSCLVHSLLNQALSTTTSTAQRIQHGTGWGWGIVNLAMSTAVSYTSTMPVHIPSVFFQILFASLSWLPGIIQHPLPPWDLCTTLGSPPPLLACIVEKLWQSSARCGSLNLADLQSNLVPTVSHSPQHNPFNLVEDQCKVMMRECYCWVKTYQSATNIYIYLVRNIIGEKIPKLHHSILSTLVSINKKNTCINDQPCSTKELLKPIKRTVWKSFLGGFSTISNWVFCGVWPR